MPNSASPRTGATRKERRARCLLRLRRRRARGRPDIRRAAAPTRASSARSPGCASCSTARTPTTTTRRCSPVSAPKSSRIASYLLTPKGQVIDLPRGATVLDFAYAIHTDVGHRCRGAKVNGRIVPLTFQPASGDRVEILTGKTIEPRRDWLSAQRRLPDHAPRARKGARLVQAHRPRAEPRRRARAARARAQAPGAAAGHARRPARTLPAAQRKTTCSKRSRSATSARASSRARCTN